MGLWGKESTYTKLLQRISEKNAEGLELHRQSLQNGQMYHWILSKVLKMAEEELKKASKDKRKVTSDEYLISELKAEYDRISNSTVSCYQSYREGKYTKEEYVQLRKTNQELLADLENQISDLQEKVANQEPDAEEKIEQLTQYSMLEQYDGDVLSNIIDKVFIYNDKDIEIVFKGENFIRNAV